MIRFMCPGCDKKLAVSDDKGGKTGSCPTCKTRFQIPDAPAGDPDIELGVTADLPLKRRPSSADPDDAPLKRRRPVQSDMDQEPARKRRSEVTDDDDDDIPDAEAAPRRKKKRRKRRRESDGGGGLPFGLDYFWLAIIGLVVICVPVIGLSLIFPPIAFIAIGLGWLASFAGGVWFLMVAFQDDSTQGVMCLIIPAYSLIYLISNFEETKRPFCLQLVGSGIAVLAMCAGMAMSGE